MKKLSLCVAALLTALSFNACSNAKDESGVDATAAKLLGKWVAIARYDYSKDEGDYVKCENHTDHYIDRFVLIFEDESNLVVMSSENSKYPEDWTYSVAGSRFTMRRGNGGKIFDITLLTDTNLELRKIDIDDNYKVLYERREM